MKNGISSCSVQTCYDVDGAGDIFGCGMSGKHMELKDLLKFVNKEIKQYAVSPSESLRKLKITINFREI